jgi:hypothetical protein
MKRAAGNTLSLFALVACAAPLHADAVLPHFGSQVNPKFAFENLADFPRYDFYLKYGRGGSTPWNQLFVTKVNAGPATSLEGKGQRFTEMILIAVPRGEAPPGLPVEKKDAQAWLHDAAPGILQCGLEWHAHEEANRYRIRIDAERLQATRLQDPSSAWPGACFLIVPIGGVAISFLITLVGLLVIFLRRRGKSDIAEIS